MQSAHDPPSRGGKRPSIRLTKATVQELALPEGKADYTFFDSDVKGFGLRIRAGGSRAFVFVYKIGRAKNRRMVLGATTAVSVDGARKTAAKLYAAVRLGQDPSGDRAEAKIQAVETFEATARTYLEYQRQRVRPGTYPDLKRHLVKYARPLHQLQFAKVTRRDAAAVLTSVTKHSGDVSGNRTRSSLFGFFNWGMQQGLIDQNPVLGTATNEERPRTRLLLPGELRATWAELPENQFGDIMRLLMLTGQRANEIAALRWSEINDGMIVLSADRTKNHKLHTIPLSQPALDILAKQPRHSDRDVIFGRHTTTGSFTGWAKCKKELDERIAATLGAPLPHWVVHDLRRTFATYAAGGLPEHLKKTLPPRDKKAADGLGFAPHVIEAALNHVGGTARGGAVALIYNLSTYSVEKRALFDQWSQHLLAIVEDRESVVTPLRRA